MNFLAANLTSLSRKKLTILYFKLTIRGLNYVRVYSSGQTNSIKVMYKL